MYVRAGALPFGTFLVGGIDLEPIIILFLVVGHTSNQRFVLFLHPLCPHFTVLRPCMYSQKWGPLGNLLYFGLHMMLKFYKNTSNKHFGVFFVSFWYVASPDIDSLDKFAVLESAVYNATH